MKRFIRALLASVGLLSAVSATPAISAILIVDGSGNLTGATGVNVLGTVYDVVFIDGTCASVFGGCDNQEDFAFGNSQEASSAAQALLDQVFVGLFDNDPALTSGCSDVLRCTAWLPYHTSGFSIDVGVAQNWYSGQVDRSFHGTFLLSDVPDFSQLGEDPWVWAKFTRAVPEPSTWAMMLLGFALSGFLLRRSGRTMSFDLRQLPRQDRLARNPTSRFT
ncbi:PEPxxWA-CTERM sorting domain-containing protein [Sphingomonas daechungensis]|nr:PEPxxWA-CTERM sorting domain-containing protein [Sphingomonas daechungensis]